MPAMTKAQARKRLLEAQEKFKKVYFMGFGKSSMYGIVRTADMEAIEKIVKRCLSRIQ
tara:strand:- start:388 stop:561 length:174 start_codon:yes stop_codon:yes gene_type:complete